ncbi:uncharacterized protein EI90DRAFT_469771 [Cantharellus anzutake]|uniref:uncharacterized protein n=1 Tax=Cantharellus anzutake TaxID=1750568 RepID=UPI001907E7FB|nr:uncharacterized protein EI90DRAFT_469771 [Cantharellus anzutake]KAF8314346.1 hypothetical protein EI90DRAFT_469771 [Cantharellus anzutake]
MSQRNIKSASYPLVSYARAHDYDQPSNPPQKPKWNAKWMHRTLQVALDEVSSTNGAPLTIRLRVFQSSSSTSYSSQAPQEEVHEDIDLTRFQHALYDSPTRNIIDQHGLPLRAAYRGNQLLFRYPHPFFATHNNDPPTYRRFQIVFYAASDCTGFVSLISRVCQCLDNNDVVKNNARRVPGSIVRGSSPTMESQMIHPRPFPAAETQEDFVPPSSQPGSQTSHLSRLYTPKHYSHSQDASYRLFPGPESASNASFVTPSTVSVPNPGSIPQGSSYRGLGSLS